MDLAWEAACTFNTICRLFTSASAINNLEQFWQNIPLDSYEPACYCRSTNSVYSTSKTLELSLHVSTKDVSHKLSHKLDEVVPTAASIILNTAAGIDRAFIIQIDSPRDLTEAPSPIRNRQGSSGGREGDGSGYSLKVLIYSDYHFLPDSENINLKPQR